MLSQARRHIRNVAVSHRDISIPMRDGVTLVADLWGGNEASLPVVLERTPYGRRRTDQSERNSGEIECASRIAIAETMSVSGFIYIVQDCRGTGQSEGVFSKYVQEPQDTGDTLCWIRAQSWCDGFVAMTGFSYGAACQMSVIGTGENEPDAIFADCGGFSDALLSGVRQGGALMLKQATWAHAQAIRDAQAAGDENIAAELSAQDLSEWLKRGAWSPGYSPLGAAPYHEANLAAMWRAGTDGPFWDRPGLRLKPEHLAKTDARIFFVTSWHDTSLHSTFDNFAAMTQSHASCPQPELIVGPWTHGDRWSSVAGGVEFGPEALPENGLGGSVHDLRSKHLMDSKAGIERHCARIRWFEMGGGDGARLENGVYQHSGRWRSDHRWPPANAREMLFYLSGPSLANNWAPLDRSFVSDPDDPFPTLGGAINSGAPIMEGGMWDQSPLNDRTDVLRFETEPLDADLVLAGPVSAQLYAQSDAPDFDLTIKLVDVYPGGPAFNLSDGITRARHRATIDSEDFLDPGTIARIDIAANPVGARVQAGHRLRLDVAASNFPNFDINPQTGGAQGFPAHNHCAAITLSSTKNAASTLNLTVLPL